MRIVSSLITRYRSVFRFLVVGGLSFVIDYGLLLIAYYLYKAPLVVVTTTGFLGGLVVNFALNKYWTFEAPRGVKHSTHQAVLFGLLVLINLIFTNLIVVVMGNIGIGPELSKPTATAIIMVINYVAYRQIIFKVPSDPINLA